MWTTVLERPCLRRVVTEMVPMCDRAVLSSSPSPRSVHGRLRSALGRPRRTRRSDPVGSPVMTAKRAIITGCSTGIGRATAIELTARGYEVVATARRVETLADLKVAHAIALD